LDRANHRIEPSIRIFIGQILKNEKELKDLINKKQKKDKLELQKKHHINK